MAAAWWLNDQPQRLAEERGRTLAQSVPNNVTSEMGLALMDVADVIRPHRGGGFSAARRGRGIPDDLPRPRAGAKHEMPFTPGSTSYRRARRRRDRHHEAALSERSTTLVPILLGHIEH